VASPRTTSTGRADDATATSRERCPPTARERRPSFCTPRAHCSNVACSAATTATLDSAGSVGYYTSVTIGADGLGLISYYDATNLDLKVAHCANVACSSADVVTSVDSIGNVGQYTSITIGADGLPLVSYHDATNGFLKVAHCDDAACSSAATATLDVGNVGEYTSVTIGADGLGLISYYDVTNGQLKVAHCANVACSFAGAVTTLDSSANVGQYSAVTIGADGLPLISYYDQTNGDLKVAHCASGFCTSYFRRR
jgi:hypothetical protein